VGVGVGLGEGRGRGSGSEEREWGEGVRRGQDPQIIRTRMLVLLLVAKRSRVSKKNFNFNSSF
jgi:hypothetical protein